MLWQLKTNEGMASQLAYFDLIAGDWHYLTAYMDKIGRFNVEDVKRVANRYLVPSNRTIAVLEP
jgi:predicted Zn-dependent peptidase